MELVSVYLVLFLAGVGVGWVFGQAAMYVNVKRNVDRLHIRDICASLNEECENEGLACSEKGVCSNSQFRFSKKLLAVRLFPGLKLEEDDG